MHHGCPAHFYAQMGHKITFVDVKYLLHATVAVLSIMGIKNGSMLLNHVGGISMNNLITILQHQASQCCEKASPAVAFDVNWLAQRFGQYKVGPVPSIFQFAEAFLCQGGCPCSDRWTSLTSLKEGLYCSGGQGKPG